MTQPLDPKANLKRRNKAVLLVIIAFITLIYFVNMVKLHGL